MEEEELTDEMINQLCSFMRTIDLMQKHPEIFETVPEIKQQFSLVKENVDHIFSLLTEEQCNEVLEIHQLQLQEIAESENDNVLDEESD